MPFNDDDDGDHLQGNAARRLVLRRGADMAVAGMAYAKDGVTRVCEEETQPVNTAMDAKFIDFGGGGAEGRRRRRRATW